jgi:Uma2 family endonuclease
MARIAVRSKVSVPEFLFWERQQPVRHEYVRGDVFAMTGASPRHSALCSSVNTRLQEALRDGPCNLFIANQRVGVGSGELYFYPDVAIVCGALSLEDGTRDVVANPGIVVEVLSSSTEQYDRGLKWEGYQRLQSLTDYLLVSQDEPRIEHFRRESAGSWIYRAAASGERVKVSRGASLDVDAIFARVLDLPGDA